MEDNTAKKHHLHIYLGMGYEPLQKCKRSNNEVLLNPSDKADMRLSRLKHIDLWCDGSLYPIDPQTVSHPPFSNPTNLLRFTGDGVKGLLGYCKSISTIAQNEKFHSQYQAAEVLHLREECKVQRQKLEEKGDILKPLSNKSKHTEKRRLASYQEHENKNSRMLRN